jgi:hypothetical protein
MRVFENTNGFRQQISATRVRSINPPGRFLKYYFIVRIIITRRVTLYLREGDGNARAALVQR